MAVHASVEIRLSPNRAVVAPQGTEPWTIRYNDALALRDRARALVQALCRAESTTVFGHHCSTCGACCRRSDILVRAREIFNLARATGMSDADFRQAHLDPSPTWNPEDGLLRMVEGACPFLQVSADRQVTRCSVYEVRPFSCQAFLPTAEMCVKPVAKLIQLLASVTVRDSTLLVETVSGKIHELDATHPAWQAELDDLREYCRDHVLQRSDPAVRVTENLGRLLGTLEQDVRAFGPQPEMRAPLKEARDALVEVGRLLDLGRERGHPHTATLESLWARMGTLESTFAAREAEASARAASTPAEPQEAGASGDGADPAQVGEPPMDVVPPRLTGFALYPELVVARYEWLDQVGQYCFALGESAEIRGGTQRLTTAILRWDLPEIAQALQEQDPPCFLCGECCRIYNIEIKPEDIARIAWEKKMPEADVIEQFTNPGRFEWNEGNRSMRKVDYLGRQSCGFLEQREDGFFYCGIHPFKPDICRRYQPTHRLCRIINDGPYATRLLGQIIAMDVSGHEAQVLTHYLSSGGKPPMQLDLRRYPPAWEAAQALAGALSRHLLEEARRVTAAAGREAGPD